jgi:hypothetical protein
MVNGRALEVSLRLPNLAWGVCVTILLPSLDFMFPIFKGKESRGGRINHETE